MEIKNFTTINDERNYSCFSFSVLLWDSITSILLDVDNKDKFPVTEETFNKILPKVTEKFQFIEQNRKAIEQALIDDGMVELAEDWTTSAEEDEEEENCYIIDGEKVYLPISEEDFCASLNFNGINMIFDDDGNISADIFIDCTPDYFAYHSIEVFIDENNNIKCNSLAG